VECDEAQMRQVIRNIVDNAVEAMEDDGVIEVRAENLTQIGESRSPELLLQEGKYIKISIHDQGAGIGKEDFPKIFDPYFSTKERGTQKGMGLGLAAAYSIIKRHNGHIAVESQVNIGTTIHIYLSAISPKREEPGAEPHQAERIQADSQSSIVNSQYSIKRVLVMDDEELLRDLAKQMLPRIGYEVEVAWDGVEAIDLYKEAMASGKPFAMVILDLTNKGGMGGMETIKRLLQIDPHVKAIIASGYSHDPVMGNFKQYGFCGTLPKPFTMKQLVEVLDRAIGD
ncbi:MAG: response regulator, partial [Deltaproteobacteria bacterium]|nr:response regulator [Deltaproteobacteria bacterium]